MQSEQQKLLSTPFHSCFSPGHFCMTLLICLSVLRQSWFFSRHFISEHVKLLKVDSFSYNQNMLPCRTFVWHLNTAHIYFWEKNHDWFGIILLCNPYFLIHTLKLLLSNTYVSFVLKCKTKYTIGCPGVTQLGGLALDYLSIVQLRLRLISLFFTESFLLLKKSTWLISKITIWSYMLKTQHVQIFNKLSAWRHSKHLSDKFI